ncbi:MAG: AAA family ATPase, partial [Deltaproteobacteria bacterium]|nr:AAA family ATPase [Deltaproteobacteria bacterium]
MRVTRLEIFGFKSFVDRFVLNFDENIIGIVGPNGCGKSNIVDSLRWVLGETHARQLRGNVFDDLIFNGSQTRRPLGMAEVSLTIRPRESWSKSNVVRVTAPGLAEDVVVTAEQLPQNGNGAETAEGTPELTDEWLSADELNERLESVPAAPALEPVDAAASGEAPATSFMDIPGLFQAEEIQLTRRLYRSGESEYFINRVPCRLRDMIEFYRLIGLGARGLSIVQQGQIAEIISRKPLERRELIEEAAGIAGFRARIEVAERKLEKTNTNIARLNDLVNEIEKQVRSLARQAKRARDRSELKAQLKDLELSIFRARVALTSEREANSQNALAGLERQFQELEERLSIHSAKNTESTAELEVWEQRIADVRLKRDRLMAEITQRQSERSERELALSRLEGRIRLVENNLRRIDERKEAIGVEIERRRIDFERFQVRQDEIQAKRGTAEERLKALESRENAEKTEHDANLEARIAAIQSELTSLPELSIEIAALEANTKRLREALRTENGATHEKRIRAASLESEIRSIQSQFQAFAEHVKKGAGLDDDAIEQSAPLLAKLRAPEHLQRPLAAVLGERGKYLVTQESRQLAERFQTKKERDKGSPSQFGVLDATYNGVAGRRDLPSTPTSGGRRILEELDIDGDVQSLMSALLGHVYLCTDIVQAQSVVAELAPTHGEVIAVTPDGEVVAPWGWHTTEGKGATFSFARVIEQRTTELQTVQAEHDSARERARGVELELAR